MSEFWIKQLLNGITQGSIYALMAIGYSLIFGKLLLVTFAYGEMVIFGVFVGYYLHAVLGLPLFLAMILTLPIAWLLGLVVDKICYEKFRDQPRFLMLITTIGFGIFLKSFTQIIFGSGLKSFPDLIKGSIVIGNIPISYIQIFIIFITGTLLLALGYFLNKTKFGMGIKALSVEQDAAKLVGIDVEKSIKFGHSLGVTLGVFGGLMLASFYNSFGAMMSGELGLKAFTVVVLGGITSMPGAILGGYILGISENMAVAIFSSEFRGIVAFAILITILVLKPSGLFGDDVDLF